MTLVVTTALELHINQRTNMLKAAVMRDRTTAREMATSAIHLAMAILIKDRLDTESDSLQEDWADDETIAAILNEIPFEEGKIELKIADEMSKIQINALLDFPEGRQFNETQKKLWEDFGGDLVLALTLLEGLDQVGDMEETDPTTIINSLKDWLDSGDDDAITGLNGAESDYYQDLDPPYKCKNGPFDHLSEVQLVKGITPELFAGVGGMAGLNQYVTVYGAEKTKDGKFTFPGKININTAELPVLTALLPSDNADFAPLLIDYREATEGALYVNDLTRPDWYKTVPGFSDVTIDPGLLSISTNIFRVTATATLNDVKLVTTAVVERFRTKETEPWQCKVLNWKTD